MRFTSVFRSHRLRASEAGATAIEYAIIGALIGIGLVGALTTTKGSLSAVYGCAATGLDSGTTSCGNVRTPQPTLTGSALAAQALMPPGYQIMQNSTVIDTAGATNYQFSIINGLFVLDNTKSGSRYVKSLPTPVNGAYIGPASDFAYVGPGLVGITNPDGTTNVAISVLQGGTYRTYLARPPA